MIDMISNDILPAVSKAEDRLANTLIHKRKAMADLPCEAEETILRRLAIAADALFESFAAFQAELECAEGIEDFYQQGVYYRDHIATGLEALRGIIDSIETDIPHELWPFPTYYDLLFSIH